jgi:hypothetical protein
VESAVGHQRQHLAGAEIGDFVGHDRIVRLVGKGACTRSGSRRRRLDGDAAVTGSRF